MKKTMHSLQLILKETKIKKVSVETEIKKQIVIYEDKETLKKKK